MDKLDYEKIREEIFNMMEEDLEDISEEEDIIDPPDLPDSVDPADLYDPNLCYPYEPYEPMNVFCPFEMQEKKKSGKVIYLSDYR